MVQNFCGTKHFHKSFEIGFSQLIFHGLKYRETTYSQLYFYEQEISCRIHKNLVAQKCQTIAIYGSYIHSTYVHNRLLFPGLHTSIDSQQMEQLQNNKFPSSQTYFVHTPYTVCTPSHASQQCWVQPFHGHSPHNSCQICLQQRDCQYHHFDQEHAYTPSSNFQHAPSHHPVIYTDAGQYLLNL